MAKMNISIPYQINHSVNTFARNANISWHIRFILSIFNFIKRNLNSNLDNLYLLLIGAKEVVNAYTEEQATQEISLIRKFITRFSAINSLLERADYFGDNDIKEKINDCIDEMYKIEGIIRIKAFKNKPHISTDRNYISALANMSKSALAQVLSKSVQN